MELSNSVDCHVMLMEVLFIWLHNRLWLIFLILELLEAHKVLDIIF